MQPNPVGEGDCLYPNLVLRSYYPPPTTAINSVYSPLSSPLQIFVFGRSCNLITIILNLLYYCFTALQW